jgi:hypothetical protein
MSSNHAPDCRSATMGDLCDCDGPSNAQKIERLEAANTALKSERDNWILAATLAGAKGKSKQVEALKAENATERERADSNFASCERIKAKFSDTHNELAALRRKVERGQRMAEALDTAHRLIQDREHDSRYCNECELLAEWRKEQK